LEIDAARRFCNGAPSSDGRSRQSRPGRGRQIMEETMLETIGIVVVVLIATVLIHAAAKPNNFRLQRPTSIKAAPEKIFPLIDDFHNWTVWSPWENIDPALKRSYSSPASGKGAVYAYEGNNKVGAGRMEIIESAPPSKVLIKLDFIKPFKANNMAEFTLQPAGDLTNVTWAMYGPSPYLVKLMTTFFSMEKMVGAQFEEGLAKLKAVAER
jgi:hypothetical protein